MCGRYELTLTAANIVEAFHLDAAPTFAPNLDLRPTEQGLVVRNARDGRRECMPLRWGLVPHWAPSLAFGSRTINARAETIDTAKSFAESFRTRRCVVPASAFFEWSGERGHKVKHRISLPDDAPIGFAGLWAKWRDVEHERTVETFTIVTCAPSAQMRAVHDRMPVILEPDSYDAWLSHGGVELLRPYTGELVIEPPLAPDGPLFA